MTESQPARTGARARSIAALGLPMLVGAVAATMSGVIDIAMIGHYGAADVVAVAGAVAVFDIFANVVLASVVGHQILAARFAGRGDPAGVRDSARTTLLFSGLLALAAAALCAALGGPLTGLVTGDDARLERIAGDFLLACAPTLLLLVPFSLLSATLNAYKRPRYTMVAAIGVNVVNLLLDWLLIYGVGPAPRLGAVGSGLATTASWAVGVVFLLAVAARLGLVESLRRAGPAEPVDFETSVPRLAWPVMLSMALDYTSTAVFFAVVGHLGAAALGGGRIAFQVMIVVYGVLAAFCAGGRILVGRSLGARDFAEARALWRTSQVLLLAFSLPVGALLVFLPDAIGALFTSFPQVQSDASTAIRVVGLCLPLMAWTLGGVSALRALGQTRADMYGNLLAAACVQVPVAWLVAEVFGYGVAGAFVGVVGYWLVRGTASELLARRAMHRAATAPAPAPPAEPAPTPPAGATPAEPAPAAATADR
jgi:putative MATE family efflux protein